MNKRIIALLLSLTFAFSLFTGCAKPQTPADSVQPDSDVVSEEETDIDTEGGEDVQDGETIYYGESYTGVEQVSAYLFEWQELPPNFITKKEAENLGWVSSKGNLWDVADGMSIGGDYFGNREGILPDGEEYRECDVNYAGGFRDAERLVYSIDDFDIYYTSDHYESFVQVYDTETGYVMDENIVLE